MGRVKLGIFPLGTARVCYVVRTQFASGLKRLNEQVAYKRGVAGPKEMATRINYCQNGRLGLAKAKVTHVFWIQALSNN